MPRNIAAVPALTNPLPGYSYTIRSYRRNGRVINSAGQLACITVYKKGALQVVRRLAA